MKRKRTSSLQFQTMLIVGIPLFLMVFAGIYIGYQTARERSIEQITSALQERTTRQAAELNVFFSGISRYADSVALTATATGPLFSAAESTLLRDAMNTEALASFFIAYDIVPETGRAVRPSPYAVRQDRILMQGYAPMQLKSNDYTFQDWFLLPQLAGKGMWTDPVFSDYLNDMVVSYGAPFYEQGKFLGVAAITTSVSEVAAMVQRISLEGSQVILASQYGTVVYHPTHDYILRHTLVSLANDLNNEAIIDFAYSLRGENRTGLVRLDQGFVGKDEYLAYAPIPHTNWILLSAIPESIVLAPLQNSLLIWTLWILGGAALLFTVIYTLETFKVVRPLQRLTAATTLLAEGEFSTRVPVTSNTQEFHYLEYAFNTMAARLEHSLHKEVEAGRAKSYAEETSRAKSDFLARMSHEIRTPMNAVLGFTHIALSKDPDSVQRDFLLKIQMAGRNMLSILNDILDFSKIEAGRLELEHVAFRPAELARDLRSIFENNAEMKGLTFTVECDPAIAPVLMGDPLRVNQILMNLCNNALKFTMEGGVTVRLRSDGRLGTRQLLRLEVTDTGIGIAADAQASLFTEFTQADSSTTRRFGGTGLGLAICRLLSELMGGSISLDSAEGQGSTFIVCFPCEIGQECACAEVPSESVPITESSPSQFAGTHVLVAEDNLINQEIICSLLDDFGVQYTIANDGRETVDCVSNAETPFNLILMDMQMPNMDGLEATRELRQLGYCLPILAMTANALAADRERCLEAGMDGHLAKPVDPELLRSQLLFWMVGR